ncbi:hypothetical protein K435DRAFT_876565 [Dendrothele bispora CBS 962.96]|uniref:Uncharacterized protein n=1 Tax=Dendrothele bispora (strain CBS 962.96) TaxID=1314807 RepID=A0A4S8KS51_DENBC|nr:hypothetical protein K435DRAFT_876565 [Dendrothele bispora CBS 962.96]
MSIFLGMGNSRSSYAKRMKKATTTRPTRSKRAHSSVLGDPDRFSSPDLPEPHQILDDLGDVAAKMHNKGQDSGDFISSEEEAEEEIDQLETSDSDDDATTPPAKRSKTMSKTGKTIPATQKRKRGGQVKEQKVSKEKPVDPKLKRIILVIPSPVDGLSDKKLFDDANTIDFETVLATIHDSLECTSYKILPSLSYKLESAPAKSSASRLASEDDWQICIDEVLAAQLKKKTNVKVNVLVDEAYMSALKKKQKGKSRNGGNGKGKGKGKKAAAVKPINLDGSDSDENSDVISEDMENGNGSGIMDSEKKHLDRLMSRYSSCSACGPDVACKVNKRNQHVPLTINQLQSWATALNLKQQGVTLDIPPKSDNFSDFHYSMSQTPARKATTTPAPSPAVGNPYSAELGGFLGAFAAAQFMTAGHSRAPTFPTFGTQPAYPSSPEIPSSDPYNETEPNPYPAIDDFLSALAQKEPRRGLLQYIQKFEDADYYNID